MNDRNDPANGAGTLKTDMEDDMDNDTRRDLDEIIWALSAELAYDPEYQPEIEKCRALIADREKHQAGYRKNWLWRWPGLAMAAVLVLAIGAAFFHPLYSPQTFRTGIGEQHFVTLDDGSTISINTDTELTVHFSSGSRKIVMKRGEANFTVAHDADRPFEVYAADGVTRAIGTAFNVLINKNRVSIAVMEGVVEVASAGGENTPITRLQVGDAVDYLPAGAMPVRRANLKRIRAWEEKKIYFEETSLGQMVAEYNRYSKSRLVLANNVDRNLSVSGVFRIGNLDSLLFTLKEVFGISHIKEDNRVLLIRQIATSNAGEIGQD